MAMVFHPRCGALVTLSNGNRSAQRNHPAQEFNNGVVLGLEPLRDNQLFEVRIDKKVNSWSGSIEIGVTTCDPANLNFPTSATGFREGTWVMSGCSILKDGHSTIEEYGQDLDQLGEGDRVGVLRTSAGALHFFVNGVDQGPAATAVPAKVYAVVDMYGKCAQVTTVDDSNRDIVISNDITNEAIAEATFVHSNERLVFHERCGSLVRLSNNRRTAERIRPLDEFNNGVVMTNRPLKDDEMFEIRIERLVDKWSGSIEVGITTHNPAVLDFPATMTNMRSGKPTRLSAAAGTESTSHTTLSVLSNADLHARESSTVAAATTAAAAAITPAAANAAATTAVTPPATTATASTTMSMSASATPPFTHGTIMMSGCGILTNGKGTRREYGEYNLDELTEGDRIGLMRKASGMLHYYINGMDQGVAASRTPNPVWGVVDLYGMAVKVTIIDSSDPNYNEYNNDNIANVSRRSNNFLRQFREDYARNLRGDDEQEENNPSSAEVERLLFHPHCGSHAAVMAGQRTSHRPNAIDDFNNGVVLTSRILRAGEMFEVRLDKMVDKWAGSIEIGVTTHTPLELEFPSTMTNMRSGTWMMTGNGVMHNGTTVIDDYGQNLDRLKVGDRVGVIRKDDGTLHFFVNNVDQGAAALNVPSNVYGVIDLYGQAAQATLIDHSDPTTLSEVEITIEVDPDDLRFHHLHGRNSTISSNGKSASRPNARGEFNDAIVMSSRPLRDNELFEVTIDKMVDRWSGSIEAGVSLILPEDLDFPNTMTDIDYDTWMLSGSSIMQDGSTVRNGYSLDLDTLTVGSRIGMMRSGDGTLHYYLDGVDQGVACTDIPPGVFAVIDLYGQCAQVTLTSGSGVRQTDNHLTVSEMEPSLTSPLSAELSHRFSQCCGKNVALRNNGCTASRIRNFNHGLVFSAEPLRSEEMFEVKVEQLSKHWSGSLQIGLTMMTISDSTPLSVLPSSALDLKGKVTWVVSGSEVRKNNVVVKENYAPSLERLEVNDRVGVKRCSDGTMHVYINGEDMGVAATNVSKNVFAIVDLYGMVDTVTITSSVFGDIFHSSITHPPSIPSSDSSDSIEEDQDQDTAEALYQEFQGNHGKNIQLSERGLTATRVASYNQGIVVSLKPLPRNQLFKVRIDRLNPRWTSSLIIGVFGFSPDKFTLPVSAINIKRPTWMIHGDSVFHSGVKVKERYGPNLDTLQTGHTVGILVDDDNTLHLNVNGVDQGIAARDIPSTCYAVLDLYGQCEQVTIQTQENEGSAHQVLDYREKADIEDGKKEKSCRTPESNVVKNCEYQNMCARFKATLGLPDGYFVADYNRCYCETCHKVRGDEPYYMRGDPPRDYAVPFGWCKFALRIPAKAEMLNIFEKWHVAYHGSYVAAIRKILDTGDLMLAGDLTSGHILKPQPINFDEKNKPEEQQDIRQIHLSPTIRYSGCQSLSPRYEYRDIKSKKTHFARVAFQACVKPGSYKIGPQSIGANEQIDARYNNNELEWSTKERGATVLAAMLVKIE